MPASQVRRQIILRPAEPAEVDDSRKLRRSSGGGKVPRARQLALLEEAGIAHGVHEVVRRVDALHRRRQRRRVEHVAGDNPRRWASAGGQILRPAGQATNLVALRLEHSQQPSADIAGRTGQKDLHEGDPDTFAPNRKRITSPRCRKILCSAGTMPRPGRAAREDPGPVRKSRRGARRPCRHTTRPRAIASEGASNPALVVTSSTSAPRRFRARCADRTQATTECPSRWRTWNQRTTDESRRPRQQHPHRPLAFR